MRNIYKVGGDKSHTTCWNYECNKKGIRENMKIQEVMHVRRDFNRVLAHPTEDILVSEFTRHAHNRNWSWPISRVDTHNRHKISAVQHYDGTNRAQPRFGTSILITAQLNAHLAAVEHIRNNTKYIWVQPILRGAFEGNSTPLGPANAGFRPYVSNSK